jgi:hypothetical protein
MALQSVRKIVRNSGWGVSSSRIGSGEVVLLQRQDDIIHIVKLNVVITTKSSAYVSTLKVVPLQKYYGIAQLVAASRSCSLLLPMTSTSAYVSSSFSSGIRHQSPV